MGRRIASLILASATTLCASTVAALGLGDISLKSHLNQRLDAEIELLEVRQLTEDEILVQLASPEAFERLGVDRSFHLTALKYKVDLNAPGGPVIKVYSQSPIREPFLDFVLEARWPSGKLLREYTLLLDLPVYSDQSAAPVAAVQTQTISQAPARSEPAASSSGSDTERYNPRASYDEGRSEAQQAAASRSASEPAVVERQSPSTQTPAAPAPAKPRIDGSNYTVERNDTLWEIALAMRPDRSVSVQQTMMALQRANPEAFINGNINMLKAGQILRIPDRDEIVSLNKAQAVQQVSAHNEAWRSGAAAPIEASTSSITAYDDSGDSEGRLSLSAPEQEFDSESGRLSGGEGADAGGSDELEAELSATKETLDAKQSENRELKGKIGNLEEQIDTLESMIDVSNETLRAMELSAANAETEEQVAEQEGLDARQTQVDESTADEVMETLAEESEQVAEQLEETTEAEAEVLSEEALAASEAQVEQSAAESEVTEQPASPAPVQKPAPVSNTAASPSIMTMVMDYILFIIAGVVALVVVVYLVIRQRSDDDWDEDEFEDESASFDEPEAFDSFEQEDFDEQPEAIQDEFAEQEEALEQVEDIFEEEPETAPEAQTEDVVAESDIYIAYGKYDQAEELLNKALEQEPEHHEARLKLLEIYAAQNNAEAFDPHYAALRNHGASEGLISRASAMRDGISGAGDFAETAYVEDAETETGEGDDFSFDLGDLENDGADELSGEEQDFDLDLGDVSAELYEKPSDDSGLDLGEFDFDAGESATEIDTSGDMAASIELAKETTDIDVDIDSSLDLDDSFDLDLGESNTDQDVEFDLSELEALESGAAASLTKTDGDAEQEPEVEEEALELDLASDDDEQSSLSDDLEAGLEALDLDLGDSDDLDLDMDADLDLEADLSLGEHSEETLNEASDDFELELDDELTADLSAEAPAESNEQPAEQDLSLTGTAFDLNAMDAELEAMGSEIGDVDLEAELGADNAEGELDVSDLDVPELSVEGDSDIPDLEAELEIPDLDTDAVLEPAEAEALASQEPAELKDEELDFELPELSGGEEGDEALDFLSDSDETATKLDLAGAYIDMGDMAGAKDIIDEVLAEGNDEQKAEAQKLLERIGD
ncbi:FimV/HubP family polar landmark protein [Agaribacterium haliotis]|uniref:FimV/HubP family polar landmark protein n=1 Tax=Agaribacterium haliotis TaxID=2013869 RepID=UPI001304729F|nr:FimV/HubP family polar landmark protein [Agaribacterium haliotis]